MIAPFLFPNIFYSSTPGLLTPPITEAILHPLTIETLFLHIGILAEEEAIMENSTVIQFELDKEKTMENVNATLKKLNATYSDGTLADCIGVCEQAVTKWKSKRGLPSVENLYYICQFADVRMQDVVAIHKIS